MPISHEQGRQMALPLTQREFTVVSKSTLAACQAGCHFDGPTQMTVMAMAAATLIHHTSLEANADRTAMLDHFFSALVDVLGQIDRGDL